MSGKVTGDQWWMFYRYNHDALYGWGTLDDAKTYLRAIDHDGGWSFCEVEPDSDLWQRLNDPNNNLGFDIWAELY